MGSCSAPRMHIDCAACTGGNMLGGRFAGFLVAAGLGAMMLAPSAEPQRSGQGRSMTVTRGGIVAAESPLAAQAGAQALARGGSAVDAAIAANAVMGVVSPMMNGLGGDLFAMVYDAKSGRRSGMNASGWAPRGLTPEFLRAHGF